MRNIIKILMLLALVFSSQVSLAQKGKRKALKLYNGRYYYQAIPYFQKMGDTKADYMGMYADCHRQISQRLEAEKIYEKAVKKAEEEEQAAKDTSNKSKKKKTKYTFNPVHYLNYGKVLMFNRKYTEAKKWFNRYSELMPDDTTGSVMARNCDSALVLSKLAPIFKIGFLPNVNSPFSDYAPSLFRAGVSYVSSRLDTIEIKRMREQVDPYTGQGYSDIFYAEKTNDWKVLNPPINAFAKIFDRVNLLNRHDGPATFDTSGNFMVFTRTVTIKGSPDLERRWADRLKLYQAEFNGLEWVNIKELPFNSVHYSCGHPSLSKDGKKLYFVSNMDGGLKSKGGFTNTDIFEVDHNPENHTWGTPKRLGPAINTQGDEEYPYIHTDDTLYFSSDMHVGFGGLDIFMATKDKTTGEWGNVTNLRYGLNSSSDDFGICFDPSGNKGYFSSNRPDYGSVGYDDLYSFERISPDETRVLDSLKPAPVIAIRGKIFEVANGKRVSTVPQGYVDVMARNDKQDQTRSDDNGDLIPVPIIGPDNYTLITRKKGFFTKRDQISTNDFKDGLGFNVEIELERIKVNEKNAVFPTTYFAINSSALGDTSKRDLDKVALILYDNPGITLELSSHTCPLASDAYNIALSNRRAESCFRYLLARGIDRRRLTPKGYGETRLAVPDPKTEAEYAANRRTEYIVRSIDFDPMAVPPAKNIR
jgi:outer membrane protein OmpA-like peptidoglycan-associated protein/tetratricopeptide (TPR) repeat protein